MNNQISLRKGSWKLYLFLIPIFVFAIGFVYYPFVRTFVQSFSSVTGTGEVNGFVGLRNYLKLFENDTFKIGLKNSLLLTVTVVPLTTIISLSLAMLCVRKRKFSPLYETMFSLPMAIPMTAACMVFKLLLNPNIGIVNYALDSTFRWFQDPQFALVGVILICVWIGVPFDFLLLLSAVRNVPNQLIESAKIDGAGYFRRLFKIIVPIISPTMMYLICINFVASIMTSAPILLITEGGPARSTTTLIYMMYTSGYQSSDYSTAACISVVTFLITIGIMALSMYFDTKKVHYE